MGRRAPGAGGGGTGEKRVVCEEGMMRDIDTKDKTVTICIYVICAGLLSIAAYILGKIAGWW